MGQDSLSASCQPCGAGSRDIVSLMLTHGLSWTFLGGDQSPKGLKGEINRQWLSQGADSAAPVPV